MPRLSVSDSAPAPDASSAFQCVFRLQMCPPPSDVSSASRPVSRTASHHGPIFRLPSHSIPWLPGLPLPSRDILQCLARSAQHPLGIHHTATSSAVLLHVPATPLAFCCSVASSGCTTASPATPLCLLAAPLSRPAAQCYMMSRDVA